jgi:hypothetical protein
MPRQGEGEQQGNQQPGEMEPDLHTKEATELDLGLHMRLLPDERINNLGVSRPP